MTGMEDRLRDATAATAALVNTETVAAMRHGDTPGAVSPTGRASRSRHQRDVRRGGAASGPAGWLVPALVAVVVLLVVGGVVLLPRVVRPPAASTAPAVSPARFFVTNMTGGGYLEIAVRDALTGTVTATVSPPAGTQSTPSPRRPTRGSSTSWPTVAATGSGSNDSRSAPPERSTR
ncbi:hypothetical protein [Frankia sp. AgB32]|uniref:hypothetical protein n=1 Tax=Frankia sp. AgB32 TaxID=631119 RepID=UPI00200F38E1|nr:hypothetical protein [Frankia sp. AgB32]MCK9897191.1 hypothetical protein [Frankia sp. AgB32]